MFALSRFRPYLIGKKFKVMTDHCSLCWLALKRNLSPRLVRWALCIQDFDFIVIYKSGKTHKDADCLSCNHVDAAENNQSPDNMLSLGVASIVKDLINIRDYQKKDPFCIKIVDSLSNSDLTVSDARALRKFCYKNALLYRLIPTAADPLETIVIPAALRRSIIYTIHDDPLSGHLGQNKTYETIRKRFHFSRMRKYINAYVKSCPVFKTRKTPTTTTNQGR